MPVLQQLAGGRAHHLVVAALPCCRPCSLGSRSGRAARRRSRPSRAIGLLQHLIGPGPQSVESAPQADVDGLRKPAMSAVVNGSRSLKTAERQGHQPPSFLAMSPPSLRRVLARQIDFVKQGLAAREDLRGGSRRRRPAKNSSAPRRRRAASISAAARPMPDDAPVTRATCPIKGCCMRSILQPKPAIGPVAPGQLLPISDML